MLCRVQAAYLEDQVDPVTGLELREYSRHMVLHGLRGQTELAGDGARVRSTGEYFEHLGFAFGQRGASVTTTEAGPDATGDGAGEDRTAADASEVAYVVFRSWLSTSPRRRRTSPRSSSKATPVFLTTTLAPGFASGAARIDSLHCAAQPG